LFNEKCFKIKWTKTRTNIIQWSQKNKLHSKGNNVIFLTPLTDIYSCFKHKLPLYFEAFFIKQVLISSVIWLVLQ